MDNGEDESMRCEADARRQRNVGEGPRTELGACVTQTAYVCGTRQHYFPQVTTLIFWARLPSQPGLSLRTAEHFSATHVLALALQLASLAKHCAPQLPSIL